MSSSAVVLSVYTEGLQLPATSDYPVLLTQSALLHKDAVPFSIQRPMTSLQMCREFKCLRVDSFKT